MEATAILAVHEPRREVRVVIRRIISRICEILEDVYPHWDELPEGEFIRISNNHIRIVGYKGDGVERFKVNGRTVGDVVDLEKYLLKITSPDMLEKIVWRWKEVN